MAPISQNVTLIVLQRLSGASLLVFKNKSDVIGALSEEDVRKVRLSTQASIQAKGPLSQALQLDSIKTHTWKIMTCSAMTGLNLQEGLAWVVADAKDRLFLF